MFTKEFDSYVCQGDSITCEVDGFTITARVMHDNDYQLGDDDMHNIDQEVTGCNEEQQVKLLAAREAWFNDEWFYCGIVLKVEKNGITLEDYAGSLWGMEANYPDSKNSHLLEAANEMLLEALEAGKKALEGLLTT